MKYYNSIKNYFAEVIENKTFLFIVRYIYCCLHVPVLLGLSFVFIFGLIYIFSIDVIMMFLVFAFIFALFLLFGFMVYSIKYGAK